jgi:PPOX class probable F420-dependent enzyme
MSSDAVAALSESLCMNVRSFRKDGLPIDTPVWVVAIDGGLAFFTDDRSFKFKRLRRNPRIEVAPSDVWGKVSAAWRPATCRVVDDPARKQRIFDLIAQKYGIHWTMSTLGKRLLRQLHHRVVFELVLDPEHASVLGGAQPAPESAGPTLGAVDDRK